MKNLFLFLVFVLLVSCKDKSEEILPVPEPSGTPMIGSFVIPENELITIDLSIDSTDSLAVAIIHDRGQTFKIKNTSLGYEIDKMVIFDIYIVKLKIYAKSDGTYATYSIASKRTGDVLYTYVGPLKRTK